MEGNNAGKPDGEPIADQAGGKVHYSLGEALDFCNAKSND
jgi:hypothetical protein